MVSTSSSKTIGNYSLFEKLGEGGTAKVYRAQPRDEQTFYAIKVFRHDRPDFDSNLFAAVAKEVNAAMKLNHQNIVKYKEVVQNATMVKNEKEYQVAYILMELVTMGELFEHIERSGKFSEKCVRFFFTQMIKGILHMHTKGLAHRDLKATNIMVDDSCNIKIIDLGFAKPIEGD